jgi:hypothetical protein
VLRETDRKTARWREGRERVDRNIVRCAVCVSERDRERVSVYLCV